MSTFRSVEIQQDTSKASHIKHTSSSINKLPDGAVLVKVKYTVMNYIDALVFTGKYPFASYPITPGIDAAGVVEASSSPDFTPGDEVIITGFGLGTQISGGFGGYIRVPAEWVMHIPIGLGMKSAITLGTAGITTALGITDLANTGISAPKKIAVTGAACDLGAVATALLSKAGYAVTAYVPDADFAKDFVATMNVSDIKLLSSLKDDNSDQLKEPIYDGAFDTVGGEQLSALLKYMSTNATIVMGGAMDGARLNTSYTPLIMRGINLIGVNGINCSLKQKSAMWYKLSGDLLTPYIDWMCNEVSIDEFERYIPLMLQGHIKGRIVINHGI